jgi:hypothetical protein
MGPLNSTPTTTTTISGTTISTNRENNNKSSVRPSISSSILKRPFPGENNDDMELPIVEGPATAAVLSTLRTSSSSVSFLTLDDDDDDDDDGQSSPLPIMKKETVASTATPAPQALYYDKGSVELAIETPVMIQRLEKRRGLTGTGTSDRDDCLLVVLVRCNVTNNEG